MNSTDANHEEDLPGWFELGGREYEDFLSTHGGRAEESVELGYREFLVITQKYPSLVPPPNVLWSNCGLMYSKYRECRSDELKITRGGYIIR